MTSVLLLWWNVSLLDPRLVHNFSLHLRRTSFGILQLILTPENLVVPSVPPSDLLAFGQITDSDKNWATA